MSGLWALLLGLVLLVANGMYVAVEIGLLAVDRARIEELAEAGDRRARRALHSLRDLTATFTGAQLGITMASLGLGAVAEPAVVHGLEGLLHDAPLSDAVRSAVAFAVGLGVVVFLHMVVGEMVPKNLALARAETTTRLLIGPFTASMALLRPLIRALNATANAILRAVGVEPRDEFGLVRPPQELVLLVREASAQGALSELDAQVLDAVLRLSETPASAVMTPRPDLCALPADAPATAVLDTSARTGYTRFPVYRTELDDVIGLVHVKDVLVREPEEVSTLHVADLLRPLPVVSERRPLEELLRDMRRDRTHAVLVVDEYGSVAGLVTLEDVIEELVGEIVDEFDRAAPDVRRVGPGRWLVPGSVHREALARQLGLEIPSEHAETISGVITELLGRFPRVGDRVEVDGWQLVVRASDGRRALQVEVTAPSPDPLER